MTYTHSNNKMYAVLNRKQDIDIVSFEHDSISDD